MNILPLNATYILTHSDVQLYHYIKHLQSTVGVCVFVQYLNLQLSDMFHLWGFTWCTPFVKKNTTNCNQITSASILLPIIYYTVKASSQRLFALWKYTFRHRKPTISSQPSDPYRNLVTECKPGGCNHRREWSWLWRNHRWGSKVEYQWLGQQPWQTLACHTIWHGIYSKDQGRTTRDARQYHSTQYLTMPVACQTDGPELGIQTRVYFTRSIKMKIFDYTHREW